MDGKLPYFDTAYIVRLYLDDPGCDAVRELAKPVEAVASAWHAHAEVIAAIHRAFREDRLTPVARRSLVEQFIADVNAGLYHWLALDQGTRKKLEAAYLSAPPTAFLRAADALHLACAAQHGFEVVYSNDRHLLAAAPLFGIRGVNIL